MNFSEDVEIAMKRKGIKKPHLARLTGYSYQHIRDLLNGERRWNEDSINRVCQVLGIQVNVELVTPESKVETNLE